MLFPRPCTALYIVLCAIMSCSQQNCSGISRHTSPEYSYTNAIKINAERVSVVPLMTKEGYIRYVSPQSSHFTTNISTLTGCSLILSHCPNSQSRGIFISHLHMGYLKRNEKLRQDEHELHSSSNSEMFTEFPRFHVLQLSDGT